MTIKTTNGSKLPNPALKMLLDSEIAMVNKNRWLTQDEKMIKIKELNTLMK